MTESTGSQMSYGHCVQAGAVSWRAGFCVLFSLLPLSPFGCNLLCHFGCLHHLLLSFLFSVLPHSTLSIFFFFLCCFSHYSHFFFLHWQDLLLLALQIRLRFQISSHSVMWSTQRWLFLLAFTTPKP